MEKVETQEQLLEAAAKELDERKLREEHLSKQIKQKEVIHITCPRAYQPQRLSVRIRVVYVFLNTCAECSSLPLCCS